MFESIRLWSMIVVCSVAVPKTGAAAPVGDESVIRATVDQMLAAWSRVDAKGMAQFYAQDGDLIVPDGTVLSGKGTIEAFYANAFAHGYGGSAAHAQIARMRKIDAANYVVDGTWSISGIKHDGQTDSSEAGIFTAVFVHRHGRWQMAALREQTSATALHTPS
jgi:uncharacterized protein (TIGR02246 family)